jgi:acetyltransferase-like isoleucine patch superfamily enzyme
METRQLAELLRRVYVETDEALRNDFARSLPFQDGLLDRWERARRLGFAEGASIYNSALVFGDVSVGTRTWIGPNTILDGSAAPVAIGEYCQISAGVHVYTHHTVHWALSRGAIERESGPVTIGDCVYIGPQSVISLGVTVGECSVIGANSFVNRDVPSRTIVAGSPARKIGIVAGDGPDVRLDFSAQHREVES